MGESNTPLRGNFILYLPIIWLMVYLLPIKETIIYKRRPEF
ncbi:hypothetical protein N752_13930 [Desulforamulus aquiferis]|nr:hypothetical protein N752_13930 [Desulforamulus aquiferis]